MFLRAPDFWRLWPLELQTPTNWWCSPILGGPVQYGPRLSVRSDPRICGPIIICKYFPICKTNKINHILPCSAHFCSARYHFLAVGRVVNGKSWECKPSIWNEWVCGELGYEKDEKYLKFGKFFWHRDCNCWEIYWWSWSLIHRGFVVDCRGLDLERLWVLWKVAEFMIK